MGTIRVHEFTTIDGSIGAPMWTMKYPFTDEMTAAVGPLTAQSEAILLGRNTYEAFGPAWSTRTVADDPGAPFFNDTHKYVVSSTLTDPTWGPATVLGGYRTDTVRRFRDGIDGGIYVSGSARLVRAMLADGLIDELHLFVYPEAVGEGPWLFEPGETATLRLAGADAIDNGVAHLVYTPSGS